MGKQMLTAGAANVAASRNLRSFVVNKLWCICFFAFKMDSNIGNISCKAGEILPCTSYLLLAGVGRENGKTKEREKEKRRAYNASRGTNGEAL